MADSVGNALPRRELQQRQTIPEPATESATESIAESGSEHTSSPPPEQNNVQPRRSIWAALLWMLTVATTGLLLVSVVVTAFVTTTLLVPNIDVHSTFGQPPPVGLGDVAAMPPANVEVPPSDESSSKRLMNVASHETKICDSTECVEQARLLLQQIDSSRDPCDDFYSYVCGNWALSEHLAPGAERMSVDTAMVADYAEFLAAGLRDNATRGFPQLRFLLEHCMDPEPVLFDNLLAMFLDATHLRPWMVRAPSSQSRRQPSAAEVSRKYGIAFRQLGVDALFRPSVVKGTSGENKRFVGLDEPSTVLLRSPLEKDEYELVRTGFEPLLAFFQNQTDTDVLRFEERLSRLLLRPHLDAGWLSNGSTLKVRDLPTLRNFEWASFLQSVFGKGLRPITARTYIKLGSPEHILRLTRDDELLRSSRDLLGYLLFRITMALSPLLGGLKYRDQVASVSCARHPHFAQALPQAHYCLCLLNRFEPNLPLHAARNMSRTRLPGRGGSDDFLEDMVSALRLVLIEHVLVRLTRFNSELKAHLLDRLNSISWEALSPRALQNVSSRIAYLDGIYLSNARTSTAQFFYTWIRKSLEKRLLTRMSSHTAYPGWTGGFLTAEGHMEPPFERVEIPLPVFDLLVKDDPALRPLQMARAAPRIYRAVFRAIYHWVFNFEFSANTGAEGRSRSLAQSMQDLRHCLEEQYGSLSWPEKDAPLNASRTSWSDLWDVLSLRPTLDAFMLYANRVSADYRLTLLERWNASQLFFVFYAANFCEKSHPRFLRETAAQGPRSPAWYRVNGPLRNAPEFAEAFGCTRGSFMNPLQKCILYS
ncbi:hypothetical protein V5799_008504 [Amblyomma americanum]|uniref:M13 family peptidase n=1 Tax=Amblyomma americanum TaxID=6943 RepID=A0AAQ4FEJ5_AMBAM